MSRVVFPVHPINDALLFSTLYRLICTFQMKLISLFLSVSISQKTNKNLAKNTSGENKISVKKKHPKKNYRLKYLHMLESFCMNSGRYNQGWKFPARTVPTREATPAESRCNMR